MASGCGGRDGPAKAPSPEASSGQSGPLSVGDEKSVEASEGVTAGEVLASMVRAYRDAETYFDNALYRERFVQRADGVPHEPPPHQVSVVFARPNRFRLTRREPNSEGDDYQVTVISDGARWVATTSDSAEAVFDDHAPDNLTLQSLLDADQLAATLLPVPIENLFPQLDLLIATEKAETRLLQSAEAKLLLSKNLNGAACHRVMLKRSTGEYIAWIDKEQSLLRRLEIPTEAVRRELDPRGDLLRLELWIDFDDANFGTPIGPQTFAIDLPEKGEEEQTLPEPADETPPGDEESTPPNKPQP